MIELSLKEKYLKVVEEKKTAMRYMRHTLSLIPYYGGKYNHVGKYLPYIYAMSSINKCHTYAEIAGGGARFLLNIDNELFIYKVYNELGLGLSSLFQCVKSDEYKVLMKILSELEYNENIFKYAIENKNNDTKEVLERALFTYISAKMSYNASMKHYREMESEINTMSIERIHEQLNNTFVLNGDFKCLLNKWGIERKILKLIDPPYHPVTRHEGKADSYEFEMTEEDHKHMVEMLCKCNSWILCGYDPAQYNCDDYKPLEELAMKISMGSFKLLSGQGVGDKNSYKEEFIWVCL